MLRDIDRFRLFVWELEQLADQMRVEVCPHAEHLEHLTQRFLANVFEDQPSTE